MWKVLFAFLALMTLPSEAHAVTALVGGLGGGAIVQALLGLALSYIVNKAFAPEQEERPAPTSSPDSGVKQRIPTDPRNKLPVVYGTKSVSGQITYAEISNDNQKMAFIISLAEGPVSSINSVKWEDKTISFNDSNLAGGLRTAGNSTPDSGGDPDDFLSGRFKVRVFPTGGACTEMETFSTANNSSKWSDTNHTMPNTAYAFVELTYDQEKRVTSLTNRLQFGVTGRTIKEITSSTTAENYESGSDATDNDNPAEIIVDYLTNTRYGAGVPLSAIDFASFSDHKDFCNENPEYINNADVKKTDKKRYTTNGSLNTNQDVDQNVTDLTVGNSGFLTWNYGQFGIVSDKERDSIFSFSEDNIFGKLQIGKLGFDNKINELTARFDSENAMEQEEQVIVTVPESNRNLNEPVLERTITLPMTNNTIEAKRVSAVHVNKSRQDLTVNFTTSLEASGVEAGDVISITHATPGFVDKEFIVQSVEEKVVDNIIGLEITGQEYADGVYDFEVNDEDPAPNTRLPNPFEGPKISNLIAVENTSVDEPNLNITWVVADDSVLIGETEIGYRNTILDNRVTTEITHGGSTPASSLTINGNAAQFPASGTLIVGATSSAGGVLTNPGTVVTYTSVSGNTFSGLNTPATATTFTVGDTVTVPLTFKSTAGTGTIYELGPLTSLAEKVITRTLTGTPAAGNFVVTLTSGGGTVSTATTPILVTDTVEEAAAKIVVVINTLSAGYTAEITTGSTIQITGANSVGNFTTAATVQIGLTLGDTNIESPTIGEYYVQLTAISTLGVRSDTLTFNSALGAPRVVGEPGADGAPAVTTLIEIDSGSPIMINNTGSVTLTARLVIGGDIEPITSSRINSYQWSYTESGGSGPTVITHETIDAITGNTSNPTGAGDYDESTIIIEADGTALGVTTSGGAVFECEIDYT